ACHTPESQVFKRPLASFLCVKRPPRVTLQAQSHPNPKHPLNFGITPTRTLPSFPCGAPRAAASDSKRSSKDTTPPTLGPRWFHRRFPLNSRVVRSMFHCHHC